MLKKAKISSLTVVDVNVSNDKWARVRDTECLSGGIHNIDILERARDFDPVNKNPKHNVSSWMHRNVYFIMGRGFSTPPFEPWPS